MKRITTAILCCMILAYTLSGCQLATKNADITISEDRLVGLFITTEYLDLSNFEDPANNGSIGRLYATQKSVTLTNEKTDQITKSDEFEFEDISGIAFFSATIPATDEQSSYTTVISNEGISDAHTALNYGEDEETMTLTGTLFITPKGGNSKTFHANPVYQSMDGRVYTTTGNGFIANHEAYSEGPVFTEATDATTTIVKDGKKSKGTTSITLSISIMFEPKKITVLQMSAGSEVLSRDEYTPGSLPETLPAQKDTAYIIVETEKIDNLGSPVIERKLYGADDENIETFFARDDGICVKQWTQIDWGTEK